MGHPSVNAAELEIAAAASWPARHTETIHGWLLRFTDGYTHRGNSVATHAFDGGDVEACIAAVERAHARHGLPAMFQIGDTVQPLGLEARLTARGYETITPTLVCTARTAAMRAALPDAGDVTLERGAGFDALVIEGSRLPADGRERLDIVSRMNGPLCVTAFADGEAVACGLGIRHEGWIGINLMRTGAVHRRKGHAQRVLAAIARWAEAQGVGNIYLAVERENAPARLLYAKAGFHDAFGYRYLVMR